MQSDRERVQENVKQRTVSLWSYINSSIDNYRNPLFLPHHGVLEPVASIRLISLWKGLYCRWNPGMRPQVRILEPFCEVCLNWYRCIIFFLPNF